jgi:hypothetical protein
MADYVRHLAEHQARERHTDESKGKGELIGEKNK